MAAPFLPGEGRGVLPDPKNSSKLIFHVGKSFERREVEREAEREAELDIQRNCSSTFPSNGILGVTTSALSLQPTNCMAWRCSRNKHRQLSKNDLWMDS